MFVADTVDILGSMWISFTVPMDPLPGSCVLCLLLTAGSCKRSLNDCPRTVGDALLHRQTAVVPGSSRSTPLAPGAALSASAPGESVKPSSWPRVGINSEERSMLQSSPWGWAEAGHLPEAAHCLVPFFLLSLPLSLTLLPAFPGSTSSLENPLHKKEIFTFRSPSRRHHWRQPCSFLNSLNKYEHCHSATMTPSPQPTPQARAVWSFQENASLVCVN